MKDDKPMTMSQVIRIDTRNRHIINKKIKDWEKKNYEKEQRYEAE